MNIKILEDIIKIISEFEHFREVNGGEDSLINFLEWLKEEYIKEKLL